jgi:MFS transporter, DHA2 family, methylenomycin A resistance protein
VSIIGGQVLMVIGLLGLALAPVDLPLWAVAALMVPVGVGGSFTVPPLTSLLLDAVPAPRAGTASGVNTARQVGGSLGVAASGAVIAHPPRPTCLRSTTNQEKQPTRPRREARR